MNRIDIRQEIQEILEGHFINDKENEWVNVIKLI